jgi:phosphoglycerol transferase MdoB-like AlkP superfamily enzyme
MNKLDRIVECGCLSLLFKKYNILLVIIGVFLAIELFLVQEYVLKTFVYMNGLRLLKYSTTRFVLDLLFSFMLLELFRKKTLIFIYTIQFIVYILILTYNDYFGRPPHLTTIFYQFGEGVSVLEYILDLIGGGAFFLVLSFMFKTIMTVKYNIYFRKKNRILSVSGVYILVIVILALYIKPLNVKAGFVSVDELMHGYGFTIPWVAEMVLMDQNDLLKAALEEGSIQDNRLNQESSCIQLPRKIFILQVESLDFDILRSKINGREVTPNINSILPDSKLYKVRALHYSGSSDSDFVMLTGRRPNKIIAPYKVQGYQYTETLIDAARKAGYYTKAYHGNRGFFFERRSAFKSMGFDELIFREELVGSGIKTHGEWVLDNDLLKQVIIDEKLSENKELYFIITVTSHGPFNFLPESEKYSFKSSENNLRIRYLNSIHYVDKAIGFFLKNISNDSLVILYGDHESGTGRKSFDDKKTRIEYIPAIVYYKDPVKIICLQRFNSTYDKEEAIFLSDFANMIKFALLQHIDTE